MEFEGATPADLAVLQAQLDAAREAEPDYFKPDNDPEPQALGESDEPTGAQKTQVEGHAAEPSAGTSDDTQKKPAGESPETKPDPNAKPPSKFAKNQERLDKTWKSVNDSKAEMAKERVEIDAQRAAIAQERKEWEGKQQEQPQHSAEEYEAAAKHWEKQGLFDQAEAARSEAKRLRENPPKARTPSGVAGQAPPGESGKGGAPAKPRRGHPGAARLGNRSRSR